LVKESDGWRKHLEQGAFDNNTLEEYQARPDRGPIKRNHWNVQWIPFTHDSGSNYQCLDLDPLPGGNVGQVIDFDHEEGAARVLAPSFRAYLEAFADDLEAGRFKTNSDGELDPV